ncbi:hypothetical protein [Paenibacillus sp. P36]|uniref:hypothetical protein n=1 Tax=Paenibacillus sp. P36 TaxID=3342538 RepID=UPI0038B35A35
MSDQNGSTESLLDIILECKQLIQQLEELSILYMEKSNVYMDEPYIREQRPTQGAKRD